MKNFLYCILSFIILLGCENNNIEEKYKNNNGPLQNLKEIAWFPLDGNLTDSSNNKTPIAVVGKLEFTSGLNNEYGQGIKLDGNTYLAIPIGFYDTLALLFWIKGNGEISLSNKPVLFDYGQDAISTSLYKIDAASGPTNLIIKNNSDSVTTENEVEESLNSFYRYSFLYFEAGGSYTKIRFKGYYMDGSVKAFSKDYNFSGFVNPKSDILYIGRSSERENLSNSYFYGAIDEIHIFRRGLTDDEIESFSEINTE